MKKKIKVLMVDNYDSFTYNLVHYIEELKASVEVVRNNKISIKKIKNMKPDIIFISPGPCSPKEAGISVKLVTELGGKIPIFGVCLGHQSIGYAYGSKIIKLLIFIIIKWVFIKIYPTLLRQQDIIL